MFCVYNRTSFTLVPCLRRPLRAMFNQGTLLQLLRVTFKAHAIFKSHKPVPISEKEVPALCEKHGEKLKYFCNTCVKTICADCERDATSCKGHDTVFATEAAAAKRA